MEGAAAAVGGADGTPRAAAPGLSGEGEGRRKSKGSDRYWTGNSGSGPLTGWGCRVPFLAMKLPTLSWWLLAYGVFVFTMGLIGYLSNPEKAGTALKSGGMVAGLAVVWALGWRSGGRWALFGAAATLTLVGIVFLWRSSVSWLAYFSGESQKLTAALLITAMLIATAIVLPKVFVGIRASRRAAAPGSTSG